MNPSHQPSGTSDPASWDMTGSLRLSRQLTTGRVLVELKQPAEAVKVYDRAIAAYAKSPRLPELTYLRCEALYAQPDKRAGVAAEFMAFAQKHPNHELAANGMYMASLVNLQTGKVLPSRKAVDAFLGQMCDQGCPEKCASALFSKQYILGSRGKRLVNVIIVLGDW